MFISVLLLKYLFSFSAMKPVVVVVLGCLAALCILFYVIASSFYSKSDQRHLIVILGGGLGSDGSLPFHYELRLNKALEVFRELKASGKDPFIVTLSAGTPHKPNPLDIQGFPITEAGAGAKWLLKQSGIPANRIMEEGMSLDTLGNVNIAPFYLYCHIFNNF